MMLKVLVKIIKWYMVIGALVAAQAVLTGEDKIGVESLEVFGIIAILWPVWVFLRIAFA